MIEYNWADEGMQKSASNESKSDEAKKSGEARPYKMNLTIKKEEKGIVIHFQNTAEESINVYGKRAHEENFTLLGTVSENIFIDSRSNLFNAPEVREYMACVVDKESQTESTSDIVLIINK